MKISGKTAAQAARTGALALAALLSLASAALRGPQPAKLDVKKVTAVELSLVGGGATFCPNGTPAQMRVVATVAGGKQQTTWAQGESRDGKLEHAAFTWTTDVGAIDGDGILRLPADPFAVVDRTITVGVQVPGKPELGGQLTLAPVFDCGGMAVFSGAAGEPGRVGADGRLGRNGDSGHSSKQATDGENGQSGQDGGDAGDGGPGPALEVALGYVDTERHGRLALIRIAAAGGGATVHHALFDPAGLPFSVGALGGAGGPGGPGGQGGQGGFGGSNNIQGGGDGGNGGDGGDGGRGGHGGDGGDGGSILVRVDRSHPELARQVRFDTSGGPGGGGGYPGGAGPGGPGGSSASGAAGQGGRFGVAGSSSGEGGRAGRNGPAVKLVKEPAKQLFADEIARGIRIAR
jgi:hypothetical protein